MIVLLTVLQQMLDEYLADSSCSCKNATKVQ